MVSACSSGVPMAGIMYGDRVVSVIGVVEGFTALLVPWCCPLLCNSNFKR